MPLESFGPLAPPEADRIRLERAFPGPLRVILGAFGVVFAAGPWVAEASDGHPSFWGGLGVLLFPTTCIGVVLVAGALAGRSTVTSIEQGALVIERLPSPLLGGRTDRYARHQIRRVEVREDYDHDRPKGQHSRWDVCVHLVGRRRPLQLTINRPDRARAERDAAAVRAALGLAAE